MKTICIAACASLQSERSVHSDTFVRAVTAASELVAADSGLQIDIRWFDDGANPIGALAAATAVLHCPAQAVIGHFSSGAALAAAPLYRTAGLPLFLPAATSETLATDHRVYRLCDSDVDYVKWICGLLDAGQQRMLHIDTDGSAHGESLRRAFANRLGERKVTQHADAADVLIFCGHFASSFEYIQRRLRAGDHRPLIVTDDAQSEKLAEALPRYSRSVWVMGFRTEPSTPSANALAARYQQLWHRPPGIYYFETIAAVQVAVTWIAQACSGTAVETVLGTTQFDERGESRPQRFACLRLSRNGLQQYHGTWPHD
jgi:ABC-type branched-subunit amino acid transport system substrate-binding protein